MHTHTDAAKLRAIDFGIGTDGGTGTLIGTGAGTVTGSGIGTGITGLPVD